MKYEMLSEELRAKLEAGRFAAVRYSAAADMPADKVDDAVLFSVGSDVEIEKMDGYSKAPASVWFQFVTKDLSDEDSVRLAENAVIEPEAVPTEEAVSEVAAESVEEQA